MKLGGKYVNICARHVHANMVDVAVSVVAAARSTGSARHFHFFRRRRAANKMGGSENCTAGGRDREAIERKVVFISVWREGTFEANTGVGQLSCTQLCPDLRRNL